ncbi:MAG: heme-binding domain-containing protein [Oscillochloris sp.]|nr:heme-binding domain-containing protein [Oscillochloris sp.]
MSTSTNQPSPATSDHRSLFRTLLRPRNIAITIIALFALIQLVPVWAAQTNPPVLAEPTWNSPQTRALAVRACFDCHSNETVWPWYSKIAPASWLVTRHVTEGREKMNFSEWGVAQSREGDERGEGGERGEGEDPADEAVEQIEKGEMPTKDYLLMHANAQLTPDEQQQLIDGLKVSLN